MALNRAEMAYFLGAGALFTADCFTGAPLALASASSGPQLASFARPGSIKARIEARGLRKASAAAIPPCWTAAPAFRAEFRLRQAAFHRDRRPQPHQLEILGLALQLKVQGLVAHVDGAAAIHPHRIGIDDKLLGGTSGHS
jgi:hypothetical protein